MYLVGAEIGNFDYYFCENIDLSFIEKYEPNFNKYKESFFEFQNIDELSKYEYIDFEDYSDINCGENDIIFDKLVHFINTYFDTNLNFYTDPMSDDLCDDEPLYLGVLTEDNTISNINKIIKTYDKKIFYKITKLLDMEKQEISVYELDD